MTMTIRVKRAEDVPEDWPLPEYGTEGAACFDLRAFIPDLRRPDIKRLNFPLCSYVDSRFPVLLRTGLIFEIPEGYAMMVFSRSGHGFNKDIRLSNCVGIIDSDYRGEVMVKLIQDYETHLLGGIEVHPGDRIAQAMVVPFPKVHFEISSGLTETLRGSGGFGSTGHK